MRNEIVEYFFGSERSEHVLFTLMGRHADKINAPDDGDLTPIKAAIQQGTPDEVRLLVANGAVVDEPLRDYAARYHKRPEIAAVLLEVTLNADINASVGQATRSTTTPPPRSKRVGL